MAALLAMTGCSRQTIYSHYEPIVPEGWERNDSICFDIPIIIEEGDYSQTIGLRTDNAYPYKNLTLVVDYRLKTPNPRPQTLQWRDTLEVRITDNEGNVLGTGINHYQYEMALPNIMLHIDDSLHVSVRHLMRRECLPGITDIGFTVSRRKE